MSRLRLVLLSVKHHWRIHGAIVLAVMAATAVLTGALLVGDALRGSLARLTLDRLGRVDEALVAERFFRTELAEELQSQSEFGRHFDTAVPAILVPGTIENASSEDRLRAGRVNVIGGDDRFWTLGNGGPEKAPGPGSIILNEPLAREIGAKMGDEVVLRIGQVNQIPADSPLGRKTETIRSRRLTVQAVIPAEGLGRFSLRPNQQLPANAYVSTTTVQQALEQPGKVNAIFVAGKSAIDTSANEWRPRSSRERGRSPSRVLEILFQPKLADYGLQLQRSRRGYFNLTSERMLLDKPAEQEALRAFGGERTQPALTYLANYILAADGKAKIPYSTVTALDLTSKPPLGPFVTPEGETIEAIADDEIVLNRWAADDLKAQGASLRPGDEIRLVYFEPESTHGNVEEQEAVFRLKAIVEMDGPAGDPDFTPELQGITDKESIANWDPPFPFEMARVRSTPPNDQDDDYWNKYKATPKAFISLATGRRLWSSRFGETTSLRVVADQGATAESLAQSLQLDPADFGLEFMPVKQMGLAASAGTTPFNLLFLGFSFFIMAAAVMLVALLFRLGTEQRAREIGLELAVGLPRRKVARMLAAEGLVVSSLGALLGLAGGVFYAWLMLAGLRSPDWWLDAVSTPFLELDISYIRPSTVILGYASGVAVSVITILWTLRRMGRVSIRRLLAGEPGEAPLATSSKRPISRYVAWAMIISTIALGAVATQLGGEAQAGAFFGAGACVLAALLLLLRARLNTSEISRQVVGAFPIARLAARNGARNPARSTLTIGLVAAASFLIVAISAFRLDPAAVGIGKNSGSGGFTLIAESAQPIYHNLNTAEGRRDLAINKEAQDLLDNSPSISLRVQPGDDASCLNLYRPTQPRALGIVPELVARGGFAWAGSAAESAEERENPWLLLQKELPPTGEGEEVLPVVLDLNTAMYSLHLWKGVGEQFSIRDGRGDPVRLQVVGLLKNSIFQGDLLLAEQKFLQHFPDVNGYRLFLIETRSPPDKAATALERALGDYGFDAEPTLARLASFLAVQNTYLSTFQSLGGLGLLLGTFGLATVQLRSVLERRSELALMRAAGFRRSMLARLVMIENALLLVGGLGVGILAALVAMLPHLFGGGATIPWVSLVETLLAVLAVGLIAGLVAVRATLRAELLPALRGD